MINKLTLIIRDSLTRNIGKSCNLAENIAADILNSDLMLVPKDKGSQLKPTTNYERIENMSIEELANFLIEVNQAYDMDCMLGISECKYPNIANNCSLCFQDYLKSDVEK